MKNENTDKTRKNQLISGNNNWLLVHTKKLEIIQTKPHSGQLILQNQKLDP